MENEIVIFTDLHYGVDSKNKAGKDGINTFGNLEKEMKLLKADINGINPKFIINLGDSIHHVSYEQDKKTINIF